MAADEAQSENKVIHYEHGIAILNTRVDEVAREQAEAKSRDEEYKKEQLRLDKEQVDISKGMLRFTAALVLCSIVTGGITMYQAHIAKLNADAARDNASAAKDNAEAAKNMVDEMRKSSPDTHTLAVAAQSQSKAAIGQVMASQQSTKIAQEASGKALEASIKSAHLSERPWVVLARFTLPNEPEADKQIAATLFVKNTGKTPGIEVTAMGNFWSWNTPEPPEIGVPFNEVASKGVVAPGEAESSFQTLPLTLNARQLNAYKTAETNLYIRTRIDYRDVFQIKHWTTVCIKHPFGKPLDYFEYCKNGNDVDNNQ